jgi:hypothetical protein
LNKGWAVAKGVPFRIRKFPRLHRILPVNLAIDRGDEEAELYGSTLDLSPKGMGVQSGGWLQRGERVEVLSMRGRIPLAHCRVAWVRKAGSEQRCEAGLEILN